jgi:glycerol-3-phosphate acyltransferase PlsY
MNVLIALIAGLSGYLVGSISFSRVLIRIRAPGEDVSTQIKHTLSSTGRVFESSSTGATAARFKLGAKYGCFVSILDILKAVIPSLIFKLWKPDAPYYLIAASLAIVGHNYPIYYKFKGGRGLSTIFGGFLVLDWLGVFVTNTVGFLLGGLLGEVVLIRWTGLVLMIPWIWFRTNDPIKLGYVIFANLLFWLAMLPELKEFFQLRKAGELPDEQEVADFMGMGSVYRFIKRFSIANLFKKNNDD